MALTLSLSLRSDNFFAVKDKIIGESRFKLGFLYFTPLIALENVGYTSSIYTYDDRENPDWTGDAGLGLRASAIMANRLILQAEEMPQYSFYLKNKSLRSWSNRFAATAYTYIGPFDLKAGFGRDDLNQRPNLEFGRPYHFVNSSWTGEVDFGRRTGFFLTAYAAFKNLTYDDEPYLGGYNLAAALNHRESVFGFRLNKIVFTRTVVYAEYERSGYRFAERAERDADASQFSLGLVFPEIGFLQGRFHIGLKRFMPALPLFQDMQRVNGGGDVQVVLHDRLRLSGFYELDTRFSFTGNDLFYDSSTFGGGAEIYLTRFLKGGADYQDSRIKYRSFVDLALQRSDRIRNQRYYLAIPFFGGTSLGFAYNVYRLTSDALGLDYTRNFWGGFIDFSF